MIEIPYKEVRERVLAIQKKLAHLHTPSCAARRRMSHEFDLYSIGDPFIRDIGGIYASKAWRRAAGKNQVASSRHVPHARTRLSHIAEVIQVSMRISDWLGLNVHFAHAIAATHDLGHVPFGHQGEHYLQGRYNPGFCHEVMGVVIMQQVERQGEGANLAHQTLFGGRWHSGKKIPDGMTPEAMGVRYADKIAYLYADYSDFKRLGWECDPVVHEAMNWFGKDHRARTFRTMMALCEESVSEGKVIFENSVSAIRFNELRTLMYKEYIRMVEQDVSRFLDPIWDFLEKSELVPPWLGIALLTDYEVCALVKHEGMLSAREIMSTGLGEIIKAVGKPKLFEINCCDLGLDW